MADYAISNVPRRVVYAPSGVGPYAFTFEILDQTDISVYRGSTLLTLTTDYTVTINGATGTGEVTLVLTAGTSNITIVGAKNIQRTTDFTTGGDLFADALNDELDNQTIFIQQVAETAERGLKAPVTDPTDIAMTLPAKDGRKGKVLAFDSTTGNPVSGPALDAMVTVIEQSAYINAVGENIADVIAVADNESNIDTVAGVSSAVTTVATNIANVNAVGSDLLEPVSEINTVAVDIANVNTVGTNIASVNTVAGVSANVTTVAGISSNVTTVAGVAANVTTVAGISANVTTVATNDANVTTVATNIANVNAVGGISANVTTVAGISADVTSVAGNATDISAVADIDSDVSTVAGIAADISIVASDAVDIATVAADIAKVIEVANDLQEATSEIDTVANNIADVNTVGTNIADVITVAGISADVTTVADNVTDIYNYADTYQGAKASAPSLRNDGSALQAGDLYFNTTDDQMKVYDGAAWGSVGSTVNGTSERFRYIATAAQTIFTGADSNGNTLAYDPGFIDVYLNGVRLDQADFTASSGDTIVLASGASASDELNIVAYGNFELADVYTKSASDSRYPLKANNLSDLTSASTSRTNLGLGTLATVSPTGTADSSTFLRGDGAWAVLSALGDAEVTSSATDITLTSSSKRLQAITFTTASKFVILPDATTMTKGSPVFVIRNDGDRPFGIKTSSGQIVNEGINKGSSITLSLDSTADSYSGWGFIFGFQPRIDMPAPIWTTHLESFSIAKLDSSNVLLCYVNNSDSDIYAVVGTIASNVLTWGTPQLVAGGVNGYQVHCDALSSTSALMAWVDGSSNSRYYGLTISGTSITVSTVSATQTGYQASDIIKRDGTTAMLLDWNTSAFRARIITHNGTSAPTFGTGVNIANNTWGFVDLGYRPCNGALLDTDRFITVAYNPGTGANTTRVATVSGTTITFGTAYTAISIGHRVTFMVVDSNTAFTTTGYNIAISGTTISTITNLPFNFGDGGLPRQGIYYGSNNFISAHGGNPTFSIGKYFSSSDTFISSTANAGDTNIIQVAQLDTTKFLLISKTFTRIIEVL